MLALTHAAPRRSRSPMSPGLAWGRRLVFSTTATHAARRYSRVVRWPARSQPITVLGEDRFRPIAEREERFFHSELFAALAERKHFVDLQGAPALFPGSRRNVQ